MRVEIPALPPASKRLSWQAKRPSSRQRLSIRIWSHRAPAGPALPRRSEPVREELQRPCK